jgi:hypothetical protein
MYNHPIHWPSTWTESLWGKCVEPWLCKIILF